MEQSTVAAASAADTTAAAGGALTTGGAAGVGAGAASIGVGLGALAATAAATMAILPDLQEIGGGGDGDAGAGLAGLPVLPDTGKPPAALSIADASRFLAQATFGATDQAIAEVRQSGIDAWLFQQKHMPVWASHMAYMDARLVQLRTTNPTATLSATHFYETFWQQAATAPDQLRQRVKLALSEIFVISMADAAIDVRGASSYFDMLGAQAFGNYRDLLQAVSLHPMMGVYLTHRGNQKEDAATGRKPDENYAREVMQLMSIGVHQLNMDGTIKRDGEGQPIPTYTPNDISELAKVFTGFSWYHPNPTNSTFFGGSRHAEAYVLPMIGYAAYHSTSQKTFLGRTIPAGSNNAMADLQVALDVMFNHANTAPFICKQLIQRLVTSNPSPAYVARVASAFINNGQNVRGDLRAVVTAILTDGEARQLSWATSQPSYGKLREPIIRLANWIRAFGATSVSGNWLVGSTSASTSLGQSALTAPSVFNFFRPGYSPPNTQMGLAGLVAPEFQGVDEVTVAGYLNTLQATVGTGIGTSSDVRAGYFSEIALARDPAALAERANALLCLGQMSATLRAKIIDAVNGVAIPASNGSNQAAIDTALLNRAKLAVFLTMASPDYLIQR